MISKFPVSGDFDQYILHEVILHLVESRFSGSIELQYEEHGRILRFDKGKPCAASSAAEEEQIDSIIRAEQEPLLTDEQRQELEKNSQTKKNFGKALVDSGIISSSDLLDYNRTQAKMIFAGALREIPDSYSISEGQTSKHNPLNLNILDIIRQSILNDLQDTEVDSILDDQSITYLQKDNIEYSGHESLKEDEELKSILSHLKRGKAAKEVIGKVGLNPERTKRNFLFLKMIGWIQTTEKLNFDETDDPLAGESYPDEELGADVDDDDDGDSDDILKLLGEDETGLYDVDASLPEMPALTDPKAPIEDYMAPGPEDNESSGSFASELIKKSKRTTPVFLIVIVTIAVVIVVGGISFFIFWPKDSAETKENISFYDEKLDKEQLPLDQDFKETNENSPDQVEIKVPVEKPVVDNDIKEEKTEALLPAEEEKKETPPAEEEVKAEPVKPAEKKAEPEAKKLNNFSWEEAQTLALDTGFRQNWKKASEIWAGPLSRTAKNQFTIYLTATAVNENVSSVFEEFANSSRLRERFFVVWSTAGTHLIFWGIFPSENSAKVALANLPQRIKNYQPQIRSVASIR